MPETEEFKFPSVEEISKSPAFPTAIWELEPHQKGLLPVAVGRGGPLNISWEIHGDGPIKFLVGAAPTRRVAPPSREASALFRAGDDGCLTD